MVKRRCCRQDEKTNFAGSPFQKRLEEPLVFDSITSDFDAEASFFYLLIKRLRYENHDKLYYKFKSAHKSAIAYNSDRMHDLSQHVKKDFMSAKEVSFQS